MHKTICALSDLETLVSEQPTELMLTLKIECGAALVAVLPALLPTLETLTVFGSIADKHMPALCAVLAKGTKLRNLGLNNGTIRDLTPFAACKTLERLDLYGNEIEDLTPLCEYLASNDTIKSLGLGFNKIKDVTAFCDALESNTTLERLRLGGNLIEDTSALGRMLCLNATLKSLSLVENRISDIDFLSSALAMNQTLETIALSRNKIYDAKVLGTVLKHNRTLKIMLLADTEIDRFGTFTTNTGLEILYISGNKVGCDCHAANIISGFTTLEELHVEDCDIANFDNIEVELENNTTLKVLVLSADAETAKRLSKDTLSVF
jgi:Leucine-rich repeat (LRR) protein